MRFVRTNRLQIGTVVGKTVTNAAGQDVVKNGTVLSKLIIEKLLDLGYAGIIVDDDIFSDIYVDNSFSPYRYISNTYSLFSNDVKGLCRTATEIVDNLMRSKPDKIGVFPIQPYSDYLMNHSINSTIYSVLIGMELGLDREGLYYLAKGAILHDIGMTSVSKSIRQKKDPLTDDEVNLINRHVYSAKKILEQEGMHSLIVDAVFLHHENENGSGYPNGMLGQDIPSFAKIIHVADVFDAMTSKRPYKDAYSVATVFDYLLSGSGILYHEAVVEALMKKIDVYPVGYDVLLSNNEEAVVIENSGDPFGPVIKLKSNGNIIDLSTNAEYEYVTIQSDEMLDEEVTSSVGVTSNLGIASNRRHNIVIVDDIFICRRTVEVTLEKEYDVHCFDNGLDAIIYIENNDVDLIIMDIEMPTIDGVTAVKKLRKAGFDTPVIFLTSVNDRKTVMECLSVKAKDYVLKPIKPIYIYERVRETLKSQAQ